MLFFKRRLEMPHDSCIEEVSRFSCTEAFRVKTSRARILRNRKRRIEYRLRHRDWPNQAKPMFSARNIRYELAEKTRGLGVGGIGAMHLLARRVGLIEAVDRDLHLLRVHKPYHESDHVLNIAYNGLCNGTCLEDIELRRNDEVYLDALGAQRIPDPTTEGDFCRRFGVADIQVLMDTINRVRVPIWRAQPKAFRQQAILDVDGTITATTGACKQGMDISYDGQWGYHPLVVSLANTSEPLFVVNRGGNRPSHEQAAEYIDRAIEVCRRAGFGGILLRGDTDFTQTKHLDRWEEEGVRFLFGIDAMANLLAKAESLPEKAWKRLVRPAPYEVRTRERARPDNVKEQIVRQREFENIRLVDEQVAEFTYRPTACRKDYRVVVVRKNLSVEKGERVLFDDVRYFFYITNDRVTSADQIALLANDRCNQENLIAQLKGGVRALAAPVDSLESNWAYMVMVSLAWTLKAWLALLLPDKGRWAERHTSQKQAMLKMEFKRFVNAFVLVPCQIVRQSRRIVYRLLAWNPWQGVFLRAVEALRHPLRC